MKSFEHTERSKLEHVLLQALDHYFGFVFITDGVGNILYLNKSAADCMGTTVEELLSTNCSTLKSSGIVSESVTMTALRNREMTTKLITYPRTGRSILVICVPVFHENGEPALTVSFSQTEDKINDIIKNIEREKNVAKNALLYMESNLSNQFPVIMESPAAKAAFGYASMVATANIPVLLQGETGTGKEVMAHFIHRSSDRANEPFIPVNCAAIPRELMEAEFFGYAKGAFTGANREGKYGIFDMVNRGTLFLDELGELPLELQPKLLRVLESGSFSRIGSTTQHHVDVRIIAATNRDLKAMVQRHEFREDLYYRLNVVPIHIPPLRERLEDILALSDLFLSNYNRKYNLNKRLSDQAKETLLHYNWPGNIRELRNIIERLAITSVYDELTIDRLTLEGNGREVLPPEGPPSSEVEYAGTLKEQLRRFEQDVIQHTLDACGGDINEAAHRLGISRSSLYQKKGRS